jgi:carboxyl-terminal processing protease
METLKNTITNLLTDFVNGEMMNPDSIHFTDTLKFVTPMGKVVYGGGGIMPDVFVPMSTDSSLFFYNRLANSGLIFQFAFDYSDTYRSELNKYKNVSDFDKRFRVSEKIMADLLKLAADRGVTADKEALKGSRDRISTLFKAYVGRNIFDDEGFYPIYQQIDPVLLRAISYLDE